MKLLELSATEHRMMAEGYVSVRMLVEKSGRSQPTVNRFVKSCVGSRKVSGNRGVSTWFVPVTALDLFITPFEQRVLGIDFKSWVGPDWTYTF